MDQEPIRIGVSFDLGDRALLYLARFGEDQNEWPDTPRLLNPILGLLIAKLYTTIGGADQPAAEIGVVKLAGGRPLMQ